LVSYDDAQAICDKTQYCLNNDLNGFIIWELSGDVMADLSTPLLDTVNAKLTEPSLDCESLAYNASASEVSDLLDQQHPLANTVLNQPSPPPSSPPPTDALFCPTDFTGPMQYGGCTGYYYCVYGSPTYPVIPCPVGTMFDENSMLCLQTESVACSETSAPSKRPSLTPTLAPVKMTTLPPFPNSTEPMSTQPVSDTFYLIGANMQNNDTSSLTGPVSSVGSATAGPAETTAGPAETTIASRPRPVVVPRPVNPMQSINATTDATTVLSHRPAAVPTPSSPVQSPVTNLESNGDISSSLQCPAGYTGALPTNECKEYFYCIFSAPHLPTIHCEEGKLFDIDTMTCMDASKVSCTSSTYPLQTQGTTLKPLSQPKPPFTPPPSEFSTQRPTEQTTTSPVLLPTTAPTLNKPSSHPTEDPTKAPVTQPILASSLAQSFAAGNNVSNGSQQLHDMDSKPTSTLADQFFAGTNNGFNSHHSTSSGMEPEDSLVEIHGEEDSVSFLWSSSSSYYSSVEYGESPSFSEYLPDDMHLDRPFITIELLLNDRPEDIGWELLSLARTIKVTKSTGSYATKRPKSIVYEGISLRAVLDSSSDDVHELVWKIWNVGGKGLDSGGGYFKVYGDFPSEGNLLATGGDFDYMDSVAVVVSNDGQISVVSESTPQAYSKPTSPGKPATGNSLPQDIIDNQFRTRNFSNEDGLLMHPSKERGKSILIPALASFTVIAVVIGLVLIVVASRRESSPHDLDAVGMIRGRDEGHNFDHGYWDRTGDQGSHSSIYSDIIGNYNHSSGIDPPDSFERKTHPTRADIRVVEPPEEPFYDTCSPEEHHEQDETPNNMTGTSESNSSNPLGGDQTYDMADIEELLESTGPDTSLPDIYSMLDKLEEQAKGKDDNVAFASDRSIC
jgi:hypothetical protein